MNPAPSDVSSATVGWFPIVFPAVFSVFTLILGLLIPHRLTSKRERDAREALRRDQLAERRATFQRETLLALQEAILDLVRVVRASYDDRTGSKTDLKGDAFFATMRVSVLSVRVRDATLRNLVHKFDKFATDAGATNADAEALSAAINGMAAAFYEVQDRTGELLRTLDDYEDSLVSDSKSRSLQ